MVMRRLFMMVVCLFYLSGIAAAQDNDLVAENIAIKPETDLISGQQILTAEGTLTNQSSAAYTNVSLSATAFDANGETIGVGFGYLVDACGAGLLPDFVLQPGDTQRFAVPLELDEPAMTVDHIDITTDATATEAAPVATASPIAGITQVSNREVVKLEWIDDSNLRFGVGCWRDLFIDLDWYEDNLTSQTPKTAVHPKAELVTDGLRRQLGLVEPLDFAHSFLTFPSNARRIVYQGDNNSFYSAEPDGSFKRLLFDHLFNRTLQGITWLDRGRFLAYYYGAYGDPVLYFTASVDGDILSEPAPNAIPSITVPGASPDGQRIIISVMVDGITGYYRKTAAYPNTDLLFQADAPGNNWPGPIYEQDSDGAAFIYVALPKNGEARLACFNLQSKKLNDLAPLPLQLSTDERAWWWLSPDNNRIALSANGVHSGLWLIELDKLGDSS